MEAANSENARMRIVAEALAMESSTAPLSGSCTLTPFPEMGRWLNRDPIGERGGINLYGMLENDAIDKIDLLGFNDYGSSSSCLRCKYTGASKVIEHTEGDIMSFILSSVSGNLYYMVNHYLLCRCQEKCDGPNGEGGVRWNVVDRLLFFNEHYSGSGSSRIDPDISLAYQVAQQYPFIIANSVGAPRDASDFESSCSSKCAELTINTEGN